MDARSVTEAFVWKGTTLAGTLARTEHGAIFRYAQDYTGAPIAYTLPLVPHVHEVRGYNLHPFFAGLLPEGLRLKALRSILKTSEDDLFTLLIGSGGDVIGDVSLTLTREPPLLKLGKAPELSEVHFDELFSSAITAERYEERARDLTIAGVQPKISAGMISFPVEVKLRRRFCILKLTPEEFPRIAHNELFCMRLAKECGLEAPQCLLVKDRDGREALLIERFDRRFNKKTKQHDKVHQEDACQFLGRYPADKYRLSFREIAEGVMALSSAPLVDAAKLLRLKAFSYVITNGDLHAKNISLSTDLYTHAIGLTPAYDLVATLPYGDRTMALQFEGRDNNLTARDFFTFGARCGLRAPVVQRILHEVSTGVATSLPRLGEIGLSSAQTKDLTRVIEKRVQDLTP